MTIDEADRIALIAASFAIRSVGITCRGGGIAWPRLAMSVTTNAQSAR
jgi:hypothetical protein